MNNIQIVPKGDNIHPPLPYSLGGRPYLGGVTRSPSLLLSPTRQRQACGVGICHLVHRAGWLMGSGSTPIAPSVISRPVLAVWNERVNIA